MSQNIEIERRFLVTGVEWKNYKYSSKEKIVQGYLTNKECKSTARIRLIQDLDWDADKFTGLLSVKGPKREDGGRSEIESQLRGEDAKALIEQMCNTQLDKIRTTLTYAGKVWQIDEFQGKHQGLIIAEIELESMEEKFTLPPWVGEEITNEKKYSNYKLSLKE